MSAIHNGQVMRLLEAAHPQTGEWLLLAEIHTANGPALGRLVAPVNGASGPVGFHPVEAELEYLAGAQPVAQEPAAAAPEAGAGTLTSGQVPRPGQPAAAAPEPKPPTADDPRGIRRD